MLKTLKRDWWKLLLIVLVCGGIPILTGEKMLGLYTQNILGKLSEIQMYVITGVILLVISFLDIFLNQILPACIHEQRNLWNIAWKYLVLRILCEIILAIAPIILPLQEVKFLFTAVMLVYSIIFYTLFLGFLCAAANSTGLLVGIKNLFTQYLLKYICILLIVIIVQKATRFIQIDFIHSVLFSIIQIAIVYICLPLFKKQAN